MYVLRVGLHDFKAAVLRLLSERPLMSPHTLMFHTVSSVVTPQAAQVCASVLGISLNMVTVKSTYNLTSPNDEGTGGSITSESVCYVSEVNNYFSSFE